MYKLIRLSRWPEGWSVGSRIVMPEKTGLVVPGEAVWTEGSVRIRESGIKKFSVVVSRPESVVRKEIGKIYICWYNQKKKYVVLLTWRVKLTT